MNAEEQSSEMSLEDLISRIQELEAANQYALSEMQRYLPTLERAEGLANVWNFLTKSLGIATANGYRAAIAKLQEVAKPSTTPEQSLLEHHNL